MSEYQSPTIFKQVLGLFKGLQPGSDLSSFQLPPVFNMPKSQLQCYGESVYCIGENDYLKKCAEGKSSLERFVSVVAWCISTTRPLLSGLAPYNPILGETHHVSKGTLNVLLEQVSHHPPVCALHAVDTERNIELIWCQNPEPKFYGRSIEAKIHGKRQLKLLNFGENYEMNSPNLLMKLLPIPTAEWSGKVSIQCKDSNLKAEISFNRSTFLGLLGSSSSVKGKIFHASTLKTIYEIDGHWDRVVKLKNVNSKITTLLYDAKEAITNLNAPVVKNSKEIRETESAVVWSEVSKAILKGDWKKAREAKCSIEENERKLRRERKTKEETWVPRHFKVSNIKDGAWECWPLENLVPPAPIIVSP